MPGIHHITAFARSAAANVDFYTRELGLRLIKTTVNFDDPGTYHLYFGDWSGTPGTVLTFFPHEGAAPGRAGVGLANETAFAIPAASFGFWLDRLSRLAISHQTPETRFGQRVVTFTDREGTQLALVAVAGLEDTAGYAGADVPAEHAIRGFHGVTIWADRLDGSAAVLTQALGFTAIGQEGDRHRFVAKGTPLGSVVDLRIVGGFLPGRMGAGSVHHVAFRAADDGDQARMATILQRDLRLGVTEQKDRNYFRSVYFRDPSGVIFEIATDDPGFAVDEPIESLGETLKLPAWLEPHRAAISAALPTLRQEEDA